MQFKKEKLYNRVTGLLDEGLNRMHGLADDWEETASTAARRARSGLRQGRERLMTAEENVTQSVKDHPYVFMLIGLGLLSLVIGLILGQQQRRK